MIAMTTWPWVAAIVLLLVTLYFSRNRFVRKINNAISQRGFADDDEEVTIILSDGTTIRASWGSIKKRVIGDKRFFLSTKKDWIIGGIYCLLSIVIPLAIGYAASPPPAVD